MHEERRKVGFLGRLPRFLRSYPHGSLQPDRLALAEQGMLPRAKFPHGEGGRLTRFVEDFRESSSSSAGPSSGSARSGGASSGGLQQRDVVASRRPSRRNGALVGERGWHSEPVYGVCPPGGDKVVDKRVAELRKTL